MNLSMIRGNSKTFAFALTDADGDPVDLTTATVTMTAKSAYTDLDAAAVFQKTDADGITILDAATGLISVALEPADTSDLASRKVRLVYDVQVQVGAVVTTPVIGRLTVNPDVTLTVEAVS